VEGVKMTFISCKIGGGFRKDLEEKDQANSNEPIYELEAITRSFGLFSSKFLVVCQSKHHLRPMLARRAAVFGVQVFTYEDLPTIADKIDAVINPIH
jgi:hypothetical protein